ncbi:GTP-binding protein [Rhizomicrobium palustre]|uniref:Probable GTP-binding protein EngB n=1 Tax=Rhizomicrobium palustre TaxID=189966 RepID=A0A846MWF4_9PROT|nr:ribosome biogenesis GTP-binding protein YihA/YsxC [Rhizomicrobium palustre]NIK87854.1 GTP-binding protein [Rhizomicrobium palustre]
MRGRQEDETGRLVVDVAEARKLFATECHFVWGTAKKDDLPPPAQPEVAFAGRSNVGKSSLINALTGRKALARVSQTPGRTREINFFNLGDRLMLVDLPGYGYAKASKELAAEWQDMIFAYLRGRANLKRVVLLIDSRRGIMAVDHAVMELLDKAAVSYAIALTKTDTLKPAELAKITAAVEADAKKHVAAYPDLFATSAQKFDGLDGLKAHLTAQAWQAVP